MNPEVTVEQVDEHVVVVEVHRPPNNFFDVPLLEAIATAYEALDDDARIRAIVLAAEGKHFCAGADFTGRSGAGEVSADAGARALYTAAVRLFTTAKPVVAAVQGAAIGGGLGLAMSADFRVGTPRTRFAANFSRLGFHQGFGLSVTLPRAIGPQRAAELLMTGNSIDGSEAHRIGLADRLVEEDALRERAVGFAGELARAAPLAVASIRATLRRGLAGEVTTATDHERAEQARLRQTADFAEGIRAATERRAPVFVGS
ncbi:MAG: 2-(1,2-epoxy,2-dihydrophenyl)acetyl-CoA isomerase [Microbacteriaceae bacterium]|jgi:enoyl-CoA hydratase/carnithine racemase|nr:2-(1,2-epoxy,2-dihydrophenyl)acetyl-CoA isomerase [Microbacteriaceae bacterium]